MRLPTFYEQNLIPNWGKSCARQSNIKSRKSAQKKKRAFRLAIRIITCKFAPKKPKYQSNND